MINKVKGYRNMINLSQKEMAELLGISFTSYCHKEQGKRDFKDNEKIIFLEIVENRKELKDEPKWNTCIFTARCAARNI